MYLSVGDEQIEMASTSGEAFPGLGKFPVLLFKFTKRVLAFILIHVQDEETLAGADTYVGIRELLPPREDLSLIGRGSLETVPVPRMFSRATAVLLSTGASSVIVN